MIKMIIATDDNYAIGNRGGLPWPKIKEDMRYFKEQTVGCNVIMGMTTFKSLQKLGFEQGLPDRLNIVLTNQVPELDKLGYRVIFENQCYFVNKQYLISKLGMLELLNQDTWVIGGASLYDQMLPYVYEIHHTRVHGEFLADVYFDRLGEIIAGTDFYLDSSLALDKGVAEVNVWKRLK